MGGGWRVEERGEKESTKVCKEIGAYNLAK